jgi:hypothetical protein
MTKKPRGTIAFLLLAYILVVSVRVEIINSTQKGGVLQSYHQSQRQLVLAGGGSSEGKMRDMRAFQTFLFLFGIPVYPLSAIGFGFFTDRAMTEKSKTHKALLWSCSLLCVAILARFVWLDVLSAAAGLG